MSSISLEAGDDLVERLAHEKDPVNAAVEIVWNSLDADAFSVWLVPQNLTCATGSACRSK